jgi:hypothetical protein
MTLQEEKPMDRPYSRPQLVIYGDIQKITQSSGNASANRDTQGGPPNKTR